MGGGRRLGAPEWAIILGIVGFVAVCFVYIPEMRTVFRDLTIADLAQDDGLQWGSMAAVEGTICGVEPYPFGIGNDVDNVLLCLEDGDHSILAIGDRADWSFEPVTGVRVKASLTLREYGGSTPQLVIRKLKELP